MLNELLMMATLSNFYSVKLQRVYDGDTITVNLSQSAGVFNKRIGVRIRGIDTAELGGEQLCERDSARLSRQALKTLLTGQRLELLNCSRDKYFRLLCQIRVNRKVDAATWMLRGGFARPYDGGRKSAWHC